MKAKIELRPLVLKNKESFQPEKLLVNANDSLGNPVPLELFGLSGEVNLTRPGVYQITIDFTDPVSNQHIEEKTSVTVIS